MRKLTPLCFLFLAASFVDASTIAEVRNAAVGEEVTVTDVTVTRIVDHGGRSNFFVQDATGGLSIMAFDKKAFISDNALAEGDVITMTGVKDDFHNLAQLKAPLYLVEKKTSGKTAKPQPVNATVLSDGGQGTEDLESELVVVDKVVFADAGQPFKDNASYAVTVDGYPLTVRTASGGDFSGEIPSGPVKVTGVVGQFENDYQLVLVRSSDVGK